MNNNEIINIKNIKLKITVFLVATLVVFIGIFNCLKNNITSGATGSAIYTKLLNYSMPIVSQYGQDGEEHSGQLKNLIMDTLGINIYNPISILEKELPLISMENRSLNKKNGGFEILNPFKLNDNSISKNNNKSNPMENDLKLSNKVVPLEDNTLKKKLDASKPEILIYHTHNNEDFVPGGASNSVATVGDELQRILQENYGISVMHDKTIHSDNYSICYKKSGETVDKYLNQYKDFKLIIDLHRDSGPSRETITTRMNDENVAKIMFVISKNRKNINENMKLLNNLIGISNKLYPGFCRGTIAYNHGIGNFNQDKSSNSILIELGSDNTKIEEAKATSKYLGRIIAEQLNRK